MIRFLFKTAFWFTVVVMILPQNDNDTNASAPRPTSDFTSVDTALEAHKLLLQLQNLCSKSPEICEASANGIAALQEGSRESMDAIAKLLSEHNENGTHTKTN